MSLQYIYCSLSLSHSVFSYSLFFDFLFLLSNIAKCQSVYYSICNISWFYANILREVYLLYSFSMCCRCLCGPVKYWFFIFFFKSIKTLRFKAGQQKFFHTFIIPIDSNFNNIEFSVDIHIFDLFSLSVRTLNTLSLPYFDWSQQQQKKTVILLRVRSFIVYCE